VDWAGPGVYVGDAPELVEDLFKAGYPEQAEDLLRRILWWGERFPYLPQAIRADRMDYRRDGFSGCIAGMAVPQSIVFGVFGVGFPTESGDVLQINPHRLSFVGTQELENLRWRSHQIRIRVDSDSYTVDVDGGGHTRKLGEPFLVQP
jgi:hypothetical protein